MINKPRSELLWFNQIMEMKLAKNDDRDGWRHERFSYLLTRLKDEVEELETLLQISGGSTDNMAQIMEESADIANFAMMIADKIASEASYREAWDQAVVRGNVPKEQTNLAVDYWVNIEGTKFYPGDMTNAHLQNTINLIERKMPVVKFLDPLVDRQEYLIYFLLKEEKQFRENKSKMKTYQFTVTWLKGCIVEILAEDSIQAERMIHEHNESCKDEPYEGHYIEGSFEIDYIQEKES
jgi:hypothetical protein